MIVDRSVVDRSVVSSVDLYFFVQYCCLFTFLFFSARAFVFALSCAAKMF